MCSSVACKCCFLFLFSCWRVAEEFESESLWTNQRCTSPAERSRTANAFRRSTHKMGREPGATFLRRWSGTIFRTRRCAWCSSWRTLHRRWRGVPAAFATGIFLSKPCHSLTPNLTLQFLCVLLISLQRNRSKPFLVVVLLIRDCNATYL